MKLLGKFLRTSKSKSKNNSIAVGSDGSYKCLPNKTHVKEFYIGQDQKFFIDVEVFPLCEVVRIYGVSKNYTCADFALIVCRLIDVKPRHYTLMIRDIGAPMAWRCAPPNDILMRYVESLSCYNRETNNCIFRLVENSHIEESTNPYTFRAASRHAASHMNFLKPREPISGLDLLKRFGTRVLVFLPGERKLVVRAQLNRPVLEAVVEVCARQNLCPGDYVLCNPQNGALINPQHTFESQDICEFQLKACSRECSNLSFLVDMVASMRKRNTTASISPTELRTRHQSADTHISVPRYFRPRSLTESSAYATTSHLVLGSTDSLRETLPRSNSNAVHILSSACSRECSNLSFLVDMVASMRKRNTTASISPTELRTRHQSADTHISVPRYFRPRSLTESSAYATTSHLVLGSTDSLRETLTSSIDAAGCDPLYRVVEKSPRAVASKYRKKRMAPPPPLSPSLVRPVLDVCHSTTPHSTTVFAMNSGDTSKEHASPSTLRIRKKPSSSWSTSELSPRSVYFTSRPVCDSVGLSKSFDQLQMNSVDLDHTLSNPEGNQYVPESLLAASSLSLHTLPKNELTVDSSEPMPIPQASEWLG
ncbi:hypothetical protein AHF37_00506 [Paragonimus kellicotti]|nr:hypothetical protein AHF37_00506 [Paragonimus kellicotti]